MKYYEKEYENVFNKPDKIVDGSKWRLLGNKKKDEFFKLFSYFIEEENKKLFHFIITLEWFRRNILHPYSDEISYARMRGRILANLGKKFGYYNYTDVAEWHLPDAVCSYIDDFFPEFMESNPFEHPEKYAWPYKNITISYLYPVWQVKDDRLDLLKKADEDQMTFYTFMDYVVNHLNCKNEREDGVKYSMSRQFRISLPYCFYPALKKKPKYEEPKTSIIYQEAPDIRREKRRKKALDKKHDENSRSSKTKGSDGLQQSKPSI